MVTEAIMLGLGIANKLIDRTPTYDQKKKAQFKELELNFVEELKKTYPERDDDRIMNLRDQILVALKEINETL